MRLGGAGGPAAAVPPGGPAQQQHHVAGLGYLPPHRRKRHRAQHRAQLHALGQVARVVILPHLPGGQAYLIAVAGIARRRRLHQLALRQLAGQGIGYRGQRVARAGDPHGPKHITAVGKRVAYRAANAGGRPAKGFNLGGVVVGFIFEEEQPGLGLAVNVGADVDAAGVDFLALVHPGEPPLCRKALGPDDREVHQSFRFVFARVELFAQFFIQLIRFFCAFILNLGAVDVGGKGGVAAMVAPVGVYHTQLGKGGVAVFLLEIGLAKSEVVLVHGKAILLAEGRAGRGVHGGEAAEDGDGLGGGLGHV